MKDNTYIIPAIDFYVVIPKEGEQFFSLENMFKKMLKGHCRFIAFENVDGLTIKELLIFNSFSNGFSVCAVNRIEYNENGEVIKLNNVLDSLFFPSSIIETLKDKTIDKIVEENYELRYKEADLKNKRYYNSFFEKYQDGSFEKTKERIKRIFEENSRK